MWRNPALIADETRNYGADEKLAGRFLRRVAERLDLASEYVFGAFEDAFYYLWRERRLPTNVDPFDSRLDDPLERERLARVFSQGMDTIVGHVLPVTRNAISGRWQSGPWFLRSERCYLIPGDSPVGYRLPLDSQPWVAKSDYPYTNPPDPTQSFPPLRPYAEIRKQSDTSAPESSETTFSASASFERWPQGKESAGWITRTALSAQARDGVLYVFMPPTGALEDYLELVAAIEATAEELTTPIILEGYEPPRDPRLVKLSVTPDPGVIEVNVQPCANWDELVERTTHLYEAARQSRLTTEKFMLDGRHTGTGGGNHFVLGAATPLDSPFLRRPDLLRSLITYWHNHPSLSYLFSGLFIGPTSQAPRVDEARNDAVYELELAFRQLPEVGADMPPWLIDRILRNLLVDATGNTHRAEFCIDKLYSPDSATGRLGLLEMRAFEMPPHARMSIAQQLLMRALVARFWRTPYTAPAARWGTQLHDRFMLPAYIQADFDDVMTDMQRAGYSFDASWFAPHLEFRFPVVGELDVLGMHVELRNALEPWHVMGEESTGSGTARYVDSSLERLQVHVTGFNPSRYAITCNGHALPLQPLGAEGGYVAGVRYKAWNPWSSLHPSIKPHTPLVFDIYDTWSQRSVGGCQYHVAHPGGRNYDTFPVNAYEAESRRLARFFRMGHTSGAMEVPAATLHLPGSREFPCTLDLRRSNNTRMRQ